MTNAQPWNLKTVDVNPLFNIFGRGLCLACVAAPNAEAAKKMYRDLVPKYQNRELRAEQMLSS